jgi:hypothetical protein
MGYDGVNGNVGNSIFLKECKHTFDIQKYLISDMEICDIRFQIYRRSEIEYLQSHIRYSRIFEFVVWLL